MTVIQCNSCKKILTPTDDSKIYWVKVGPREEYCRDCIIPELQRRLETKVFDGSIAIRVEESK